MHKQHLLSFAISVDITNNVLFRVGGGGGGTSARGGYSPLSPSVPIPVYTRHSNL